MPQMWALDVDIGWRSRCHGSPDFHVQRSGGLESLPDPETGASKGTFIRSVRTVERAPLPCLVDRRGISRISYIVRDANNFAVAYVYFESEPGRRAAAKLMTKDEARKVAAGIAKLPDLVKRPQY